MKRMTPVRGLVLAAGRGTRFQTDQPLPKVLRPLLGKPMILYVIESLREAGIDDITIVVGFGADDVISTLGGAFDYVFQEGQQGSGHAVMCARDRFADFPGSLVVMCGDSPLFRAETVRAMVEEHTRSRASITLAAAVLDDPRGYGRILRGASGQVAGVVEEKCASPEERCIREVNGGAYVFDAPWLFANIHLMARNRIEEYNLTDMVRVAVEQGRHVAVVRCDPDELLGVNTPEQLAVVEEMLRGRQCA